MSCLPRQKYVRFMALSFHSAYAFQARLKNILIQFFSCYLSVFCYIYSLTSKKWPLIFISFSFLQWYIMYCLSVLFYIVFIFSLFLFNVNSHSYCLLLFEFLTYFKVELSSSIVCCISSVDCINRKWKKIWSLKFNLSIILTLSSVT